MSKAKCSECGKEVEGEPPPMLCMACFAKATQGLIKSIRPTGTATGQGRR